jgi:hypothetical protein
MSEQSKKAIRKMRRGSGTAERRWVEKGRTLTRRRAQYIKSISRNA